MQNFISRLLILCCIAGRMGAQTYSPEVILIETPMGNMTLRLFEETPLHKANFLKLVRENYYDSLMFHRVINNFMIQGGDHLSKHAKPGDSLGHGEIGYSVPAEFRREIIHKKGRLAAARDGDDVNPTMASSASQFYIVMGKKRTPEDLKKYEDRINRNHYNRCARAFLKTGKGKKLKERYDRLKQENRADSSEVFAQIKRNIDKLHKKDPEYRFNDYQVQTYTTVGGTPHLDGTYTVFGEVTEGLEVIDKIAGVKTDSRDRPLEDIRMKISIVKN
jgi:cyclophilin family peptidyl-prolyl cis-trans isomerase